MSWLKTLGKTNYDPPLITGLYEHEEKPRQGGQTLW